MSPSTAELARALVASPRWEWRAGMLALVARPDGSRVPVRVLAWEGAAVAGVGARPMPSGRWEQAPVYCDDIPDLDDPATAGVVLGMLADEMGRWPIALLALVDEDVEALVLRGGALGEDLPTLGVAVARALLSTWEQP